MSNSDSPNGRIVTEPLGIRTSARSFFCNGIKVEDHKVPEDVVAILYTLMDGLLEGLSKIEP